MKVLRETCAKLLSATILLLIAVSESESATTIKDIFNLNADPVLRLPRDNKYFLDRYESGSTRDAAGSRTLKPEDSQEARDSNLGTNVEKRCSRCDTGYYDYRSPDSRYDTRYDTRYDSKYDTRYDTSGLRDRYYSDRAYDRYDPYDRYEPDRYHDRLGDRRPDYYGDRYDRDRYDIRDRYNERDRVRDQYDRGFGYDNRGYDYRGYDSKNTYRPWDETYKGTSGWDSSGRGYYFNTGRPEVTRQYGTSGYASSWNYGRGDERDRGGSRDQGYYGGQYRPRDYYDYGSRGTSYLYGRPSSSTTTLSPSSPADGDNSVTDAPGDTSSSDPIYFNIKSLPLKIIDKKSI